MTMMQAMYQNGTIVGIAIGILLVETLTLLIIDAKIGRYTTGHYLPFIGAGVFLLIALRMALVGADWQFGMLALALSGLCHVIDLTLRYRRKVRI